MESEFLAQLGAEASFDNFLKAKCKLIEENEKNYIGTPREAQKQTALQIQCETQQEETHGKSNQMDAGFSNNSSSDSTLAKKIRIQLWDNKRNEEDAEEIEDQLNKHKKRAPKVHKYEGPPFVCDDCGHESPTSALLASHRHRRHRSVELQFECPECNKHFNTKETFKRHLKRISCEPYQRIACVFCEKLCTSPSNYEVHLRFHLKEHKFICHICGKKFMLATHLNNHIKTKHENKRYVCEIAGCSKQFQSQNALKTHIATHAKTLAYKCAHCHRGQPTMSRLRFHIKRSHKLLSTTEELKKMLISSPSINIKAKLKDVACDPEMNSRE